MACTPDTVTPKGVLINLNSGSDYTNCTVYTGLTDSTVTGTTDCVNVTGTTCSLTGLSATLMEVYVKIDCEGCCSNTFRVNLDECCGYVDTTPTPTITITPTYSQTVTPTLTPESSPACSCSTYRIAFNGNCGEPLVWTDCDTGILMSEQANYFPQYGDVVFTSGSVLYICSCTVPTASCSISVDLISSGCNIPTPTPTPTPTITINEATPTPTPTTLSTPSLTAVLQTSYSMNNGGTFTNISTTAPTLNQAETLLCDILNNSPDSDMSGFTFRYHTNPIGIGTQIFGFINPYPPVTNTTGFYSTGVIINGSPTYYVKTDNDGYITEFTLMTTCDSKVWALNGCDSYCFGGQVTCNSPSNINLYTDLTVTDILDNGVILYADAEKTIPFDGYFAIYSNNEIYEVTSGIIGTQYPINGPC